MSRFIVDNEGEYSQGHGEARLNLTNRLNQTDPDRRGQGVAEEEGRANRPRDIQEPRSQPGIKRTREQENMCPNS